MVPTFKVVILLSKTYGHSGGGEKVVEDVELVASDSCDVCLLVNSCWKGKRERNFPIALLLRTKNGCITITPTSRGKSWGLPGGHTATTTTRPPNIHGSKFMLCVWWRGQLGIMYYDEFLKPSKTITGERYRKQLMLLSRAQEKGKAATVQRNVALSDYAHLFCSMTHGLADQHFSSYEVVKNWIDSWILSKYEKLLRRGIGLLPERWAKVAANDGQYFET
nr:Mariner Mos1 transposase [Hymenolepis microstoma]